MIEMGIDGVIIPDLPFEESLLINSIFLRQDKDLIPLVGPTTGRERLKLICEQCRSFVYLVSLTGVTGTRDRPPEETDSFVKKCQECNFPSFMYWIWDIQRTPSYESGRDLRWGDRGKCSDRFF